MSNGVTFKKLLIPIGLTFLFLAGATFGINKFLGKRETISVGSFKYQIVTRDRKAIYQAAHSAAISLGYTPAGEKSLDEMLSSANYLSYLKNNRDNLLIFKSTEGWDCYEGNITVFREKWIKPGEQDLKKLRSLLKEALQPQAVSFDENDCEGYS